MCINNSSYDRELVGCYKNINNLYGDSCGYDQDCKISGSICNGTCQCPPTKVLYNKVCTSLTTGRIGSFCSSNEECEDRQERLRCKKSRSYEKSGQCLCDDQYLVFNDTCLSCKLTILMLLLKVTDWLLHLDCVVIIYLKYVCLTCNSVRCGYADYAPHTHSIFCQLLIFE